MSLSCSSVRSHLALYVAEGLSRKQRSAFREHLTQCANCRQEAAEADPSLLFAALPREEVSAQEVAHVLASVRSGIALREAERKVGVRRWRRLAGVAGAALLAATALLLPGGSRRSESPQLAPAAEGPSVPAEAAWQPAAQPARVDRAPSDVTIYDLNPGASRSEPRFVRVVGRSIDI